MKKTLSYFIVFAFLFSSVFTTGCFDSKNKIFSTRTLMGLGLVIAVTATGGTGAVAFAANTRGAAVVSLATDDVEIVGYAYANTQKGEELFRGTPSYDATSSGFILKTSAEDEAKLSEHEYYLIEVLSNQKAILSAIYHRGAKKIDSRDVEVNFETTAIRHAFENTTNTVNDFVQFVNNVNANNINTFAAKIENELLTWDGSQDLAIDDADAVAALVGLGSSKFYRVYCDAIPGTEKGGDFEYVDISEYFLIEATEQVQSGNARGVAAPAPPFPIYSDATFDFYLKEGIYTFKIIPKPGKKLEDVFGQEVKKTKESKAITVDEDKKLTEQDFSSKDLPASTQSTSIR
jgi:hypothetical protein